ncbi:MAG: VWA domain-containing protein [Segetibacter sp.]
MKSCVFTILISITMVKFANAQYYLKGELKDEKGLGLQGARITLFSKGNYPFYTGSSGAFGIPSNLKVDTITFSLAGYDTLKTAVNTVQYNYFTLKAVNRKAAAAFRLTSLTKNLPLERLESTTSDGETYSSTVENPFISTKNYPETGFSIHVNKASYSNIRRFIREKEQPPADAVRIEEMLNYFNLKVKDQPIL